MPESRDEGPEIVTIRGVTFVPVDFRTRTIDHDLYLRSVIAGAKGALRPEAYAAIADPLERGDAIATDLYSVRDANGRRGQSYYAFLAGVLRPKGADWESAAADRYAAMFPLLPSSDEDGVLLLRVYTAELLSGLFSSGNGSSRTSAPSSPSETTTTSSSSSAGAEASVPEVFEIMEPGSPSSAPSPETTPRVRRRSRAGRSETPS